MDTLFEALLKTRFAAVSSLTVFVALFLAVIPGFAQDCPGATDEGWDSGDTNLWIGFVSTNVSAPPTGGNPGGYLEAGRTSFGQVTVGNQSPPWTGDWVAGEIRKISIDINLPGGTGATSLNFRIRRDAVSNGWFYSSFGSLANDGQWHTFTAPVSPTWSDAQANAAGWTTSDITPYYSFIETLTVMSALTFSVSNVPADNPIGFDNADISCGLFADDFESGDTSAWDDVEGLSI
ncbi:MAG: hypothetical protein IFK93_14465 [Acidobacteria bacterium]|nr:hypothetical protein [Candidatus Sulfomarinibacter kjeldsenii]